MTVQRNGSRQHPLPAHIARWRHTEHQHQPNSSSEKEVLVPSSTPRALSTLFLENNLAGVVLQDTWDRVAPQCTP